MSKITRTIMICESRPVKIEYEKIGCVLSKGRMDIYKVPENNFIVTKQDGTFKWLESMAIPTFDNSLVCYFRSFRDLPVNQMENT